MTHLLGLCKFQVHVMGLSSALSCGQPAEPVQVWCGCGTLGLELVHGSRIFHVPTCHILLTSPSNAPGTGLQLNAHGDPQSIQFPILPCLNHQRVPEG